jgi:hypothetical protein
MARRWGLRQARRRSHRRLRQDHRPWTCPRSPSTPACTKPRVVVKGPAPTPPTQRRSGGGGRSRPTCSPIPVGWVVDGANRHDSILLEPTLLEPTLQAVAARGLLLDVETLHLDRGYDSALTTQRCHGLGVTDIACARKKLCAKKKRKGEAKTKKPLSPRTALARRTHQLLVLQLRPAPPQHRPVQQATTRTGRPHRRPHPDRQTRQMGQTTDRLNPPNRARSKPPSWRDRPNRRR